MTGRPTDDELAEAIASVVTAGDRRRAERVQVALSALTRHERRILREAAVMGYVLGYQRGNLDGRTGYGSRLDTADRVPPDADIVQTVVQHCDTTADLFPYLAAACNGRRRRITRARLWPGEDTL